MNSAEMTPACMIPECGEPVDGSWSKPRVCRRVAGHDGQHIPFPNPGLIGDPWYGNLVCRVCGRDIHGDEPYRKVVRFWWLPGRGGWRRSFAHDLRRFT